MYGFSVYIFAVRSLLRTVIKRDLLILVNHFKRFYIDVINASVRKRGRDARQIYTHEKFKPSVLAFTRRNTLGNKHLLVHPSFVYHLANRLMLYPENDFSPLKVFIDVLLRDHIAGYPRYISVRLVTVLLNGDNKFLFPQRVDQRVHAV